MGMGAHRLRRGSYRGSNLVDFWGSFHRYLRNSAAVPARYLGARPDCASGMEHMAYNSFELTGPRKVQSESKDPAGHITCCILQIIC